MRGQRYLVVLKQNDEIVVVTSCTDTEYAELQQQNSIHENLQWELVGKFHMIEIASYEVRPHFAINGLLDTY